MIVQHDFSQVSPLPPRMFLEQLMGICEKLYCFLWDRKDKTNRIYMTWNDVTKYYNKNAFRSNLRKLNTEGLLSYEETSKDIAIELVGWDEIAEE